jgi:hypothetical protein
VLAARFDELAAAGDWPAIEWLIDEQLEVGPSIT